MKKLLALVLALVMTLGLATVSSSAAYSDEADVSLNEAVDVMSAVGVFQGSDGKFSPKENLTREQAAKLIAYLDLGESAAEALPGVKVFSDVEATRWSAKYIAYCQDAGYIAGVGDGKFNPTGELTGYAFGKMVLCVLGYDADIEGFTGNAWSINVAKLLESNDITKGIKTAASATLTREQAAQYCLNALKADTVNYDTKGTSIEINGAKIATGASKAESVADKSYVSAHKAIKAEDANVTTVQLGEKLYDGDLKLKEDVDDFHQPANIWTYKNEDVGTYSDAADATLTNGYTYGDLYTALGKTVAEKVANDANTYSTLTVYVNGREWDDEHTYDLSEITKGNKTDALPAEVGNGTVTNIYINDYTVTADEAPAAYKGTTQYSVIVTIKYQAIAKVTGVVAATAKADRKITLSKKSEILADSIEPYETEDFAKNDYVLFTYTVDGNGVASVQDIKKVTPTDAVEISSIKWKNAETPKTVTAGGTTYGFDAALDYDAVPQTGDTFSFYLDDAGLILYAELYSSKDYSDYLVLTAIELSDGELGDDDTVIARAVSLDGTLIGKVTLDEFDGEDLEWTGTVAQQKLAVNYDNNNGNDVEPETVAVNTIYAYTKDSDGLYSIKAVTGNFAAAALEDSEINTKSVNVSGTPTAYAFYAGKTSIDGTVTANASTKFVVYNNDKKTVKVYDGVSNMVNIKASDLVDDAATATASYLVRTGESVAKVVFVNTGKTANNTASADEVIYLLSTEYDESGKGSDFYLTYNILKNGEAGTITLKKGKTFNDVAGAAAAEGLWLIKEYDGNYVSDIDANYALTDDYKFYKGIANVGDPEVENDGDAEYADGVFNVNGNSFLCDSKTVVYVINDKDEVVVGDLDDLTSVNEDWAYSVVTKTTNNVETAIAIYVDQDANIVA